MIFAFHEFLNESLNTQETYIAKAENHFFLYKTAVVVVVVVVVVLVLVAVLVVLVVVVLEQAMKISVQYSSVTDKISGC